MATVRAAGAVVKTNAVAVVSVVLLMNRRRSSHNDDDESSRDNPNGVMACMISMTNCMSDRKIHQFLMVRDSMRFLIAIPSLSLDRGIRTQILLL
jgi:hypothetical protein